MLEEAGQGGLLASLLLFPLRLVLLLLFVERRVFSVRRVSFPRRVSFTARVSSGLRLLASVVQGMDG